MWRFRGFTPCVNGLMLLMVFILPAGDKGEGADEVGCESSKK